MASNAMEGAAETETEMLKGEKAVASSVVKIQPDVVSAYPITPQTGIVENISQYHADGDLAGEFLKVDSEFNAASSCIGASAAGARVFSATSSQGLKLMSEPLFTAAGMRLPLVMAVANRSLSAPLSIWNDHTDAFAERDGGMIQFFAKDVQEAVDNMLMAYRVAEDADVRLPALMNMDGFILTHVQEPVDVFDEEDVEAYLPDRDPAFTLDPSDPVSMGAYARPEHWTETRYEVVATMERAKGVIGEAVEEFADQFGRDYGREYGGLVETRGPDDADVAVMALGSLCGTIETVMEEGLDQSVKLVRPRVIRPFPVEALRDALSDVGSVAILQKEVSPGYGGSLAGEVRSALYGSPVQPPIRSFIIGMSGRDVTRDDIRDAIAETATAEQPSAYAAEESWPQLKEDLLQEEVDQ